MVCEGSFKNRPCAVKILHDLATQFNMGVQADAENEEACKAFDRECDFLKSLTHENVVQHISTEKDPESGQLLLVTELMDCNLKSYLSSPW